MKITYNKHLSNLHIEDLDDSVRITYIINNFKSLLGIEVFEKSSLYFNTEKLQQLNLDKEKYLIISNVEENNNYPLIHIEKEINKIYYALKYNFDIFHLTLKIKENYHKIEYIKNLNISDLKINLDNCNQIINYCIETNKENLLKEILGKYRAMINFKPEVVFNLLDKELYSLANNYSKNMNFKYIMNKLLYNQNLNKYILEIKNLDKYNENKDFFYTYVEKNKDKIHNDIVEQLFIENTLENF